MTLYVVKLPGKDKGTPVSKAAQIEAANPLNTTRAQGPTMTLAPPPQRSSANDEKLTTTANTARTASRAANYETAPTHYQPCQPKILQ